MSEFRIEVLTPADGPALAEHLSNNFCVHEPILNHLQLGVDKNFINMCTSLIDEGISLKAVNDKDEIGGVFVCEYKRKDVS